jgi:hypothetical protein
MLVHYDEGSGKIQGVIERAEPSDVGVPVISVEDGTDVGGMKVDTENDKLVYDISLSEAKADRIKEIKQSAKKVLSQTDWYVVRNQETGEAIPQSVVDHRNEVRSLSDSFESEVKNIDSISNVLEYRFSHPDPPHP